MYRLVLNSKKRATVVVQANTLHNRISGCCQTLRFFSFCLEHDILGVRGIRKTNVAYEVYQEDKCCMRARCSLPLLKPTISLV